MCVCDKDMCLICFNVQHPKNPIGFTIDIEVRAPGRARLDLRVPRAVESGRRAAQRQL